MKVSVLCCCVLLLASLHSCQSYNPFAQFGVYCNRQVYGKQVTKKGCDSKYTEVKACLGTCASYAIPLSHPPYFKRKCECCKPSLTSVKIVSLENCDPGVSPLVQVESAENCQCHSCSWQRMRATVLWKFWAVDETLITRLEACNLVVSRYILC